MIIVQSSIVLLIALNHSNRLKKRLLINVICYKTVRHDNILQVYPAFKPSGLLYMVNRDYYPKSQTRPPVHIFVSVGGPEALLQQEHHHVYSCVTLYIDLINALLFLP